MLYNMLLASIRQAFGQDFVQSFMKSMRSIPVMWHMLIDKLGGLFDKLPINVHRIRYFIEAHFWELLVLVIALVCLGCIIRFCKKVIRVVLSIASTAVCLYCLYLMFF